MDQVSQTLSKKLLDDTTFNNVKKNYRVTGRCPTCDGTKEYHLRGETFKCDCNYQKLLEQHYYAANIGREYHDICADKDFIGPNRDIVIPVIEDYLNEFDDNFHYGLGITFSGPLGTGKTFAMTSVLKELCKQGRNVYFINFNELINIWGSSWHNDESKIMLQDKLKQAEILGIDELITDNRNISGFLASGYDSVIRHRTSNLLPTLVTTNLSPGREQSDFAKGYSLLSARNVRIELKGEDLRKSDVRQNVYKLKDAHDRRPIC